MWVHTRCSDKDCTRRLARRNRGLPSLDHSAALCRQRNTLYSATLLYTYISRFSVNPQHQQKRKIWQSCCHKFYPPTVFHPAFQLLTQTAHVCFHERKRVHTRLVSKNRTQGHTRRNRGHSDGGGITTLDAFRTFTNIPGPGIRTANFAAFGSWSGVLPKNAESLRDSDALMCVAVPRRRGPAGLRCPVAAARSA